MVFLRPSAVPGEDEEFSPDELAIPEKFRVLGLAVHRGLECRMRGKTFHPEEFLDRLMERSHPDRPWVEETLRKDLETMKWADLLGRTAGAEVKTETPVLDCITGEDELVRIVTGVVDLLAVFPDRVEFYDYKTTRIGRGEEKDKIGAFRPQMNLYAKALSDIFSRPVSGYLVFTATGAVIRVI